MSKFQGCHKCRHTSKSSTDEPCLYCTHNRSQDHFEPMTNADRIRNMSDEELAKFLEKVEDCGYNDVSITDFENGHYMDMLEWLQTEIKEES